MRREHLRSLLVTYCRELYTCTGLYTSSLHVGGCACVGGLNRFIAPRTPAVLLHMLVHILGCQYRSNGQQLRIKQYRPDQSWTWAGSINGSGRVTKCSDVHGSGRVGSTVQNMLCDNKVQFFAISKFCSI